MFEIIRSKSLKFFIYYQKRYIKIILGALMVLLLSVALKLPTPLITKHLIDKIIPSGDYSALHQLCLLLFGLILMHNIAQLFLKIILARYSVAIRKAIETDFYKHLQKLPMKYFLNNQSGYIVSRVNEIANTEQVMASTMVQIIRDVVTMIVGAYLILKMNLEIGLVSLIILPLFIYSIKAFHGRIKKINIAINEERAKYLGKLERNVSAIERIKASVKEETELSRVVDRIKAVLKLKLDSEVLAGLASVTSSFVGMIAPFFVLWYGVSEIMKGELLLGEFFAINSFLAFIYGPAHNLTNIGYIISKALAGLDRVHEIFQEAEEKCGSDEVECFDSIDIKDLSFQYGDNGDYVLKNINLSFRAGDRVAVVGRSGSGKSTLVKILLKILEDYEGEILVSGKNIKDLDNSSYRSEISYLGQNQQLLEEDLEELLIQCEERRDMIGIGKLCNLDLDRLSEKVVQKQISGGEAQRLDVFENLITGARALQIIDEGTSNIDSITENMIFEELFEQYKERIIIYITHDLKSVAGFDRIIVMENGCIVQDGNHDDLLDQNDEYRELWINSNRGRAIG